MPTHIVILHSHSRGRIARKAKEVRKEKKKTSFIRFDCILVTDPLVRLTDLLILLVRFARLICPITTILIYLPR